MPTKTAKAPEPAAVTGHAFDADARAKKREDAPVTIGGLVLHRRRKTWEVTRSLRELLHAQERANKRVRKLALDLDGLDDDADDEQREALEAKVDEASDASDEVAYEIIALLLADDDGANPDVEHLKEWLDVEDAGDLAATLAGGGEQPADPTSAQTIPAETASS